MKALVPINSKLNHLIGAVYNEFQGRGTLDLGGEAREGYVVVLFFRDKPDLSEESSFISSRPTSIP